MPTYQYACTESACGHRFDAVQSFSDDALSVCPVCEGNVRKVFSAVGVVFKGSGFYRTDSRQPERAAAGSSNGTDGAKGKDSPNGKSDSSASSSSSDSGSSSSSATSTGSSGSSGSASKAGSGSGSSSGSSKAAAS